MMSSYLLLPLAILYSTAYSWQINATLVTGIEHKLISSSGAPRACDGFPFGPAAFDFFSWYPNPGATTFELYPFDNCVGTKRIAVPGRNEVNPNMPFVTYKILP